MKKSVAIFLFLLSVTAGLAQEDKSINKIREDFKKWQPIIDRELKGATELFHYVWGDNYQNEKWYDTECDDEDKFLYQKVKILEKSNLGTFVLANFNTISGDWSIKIEYYFDSNDKLYFIYWKMNTFQADEPLTVEKRFYFNSNGKVLKKLQSTYKLNTKEESNAGFMNREVDYKLQLNKMDFYSKLRGE
ncbi:hypothetical protein [Marivirga sp.]|uniref:hypothetical protein n=1 Tax=Marivirga sp. TaxID=2018662 RepID=UPI002D7ECEEC|nr:hypothetical protein [Marivirga sp.]HET8859591.1 hypothetical protein [Marivirga sp.]